MLGDFPMFAEIVDFPVGMLVCRKAYREFADTIEEKTCKYPMQGHSN